MNIFTLCFIINIAVSITDSQKIAGQTVSDWLDTCKDNYYGSGDDSLGQILREDGYCEGVQCVHNDSVFGMIAQFCDEPAENKTCVKSLSSFPNCCNEEICYEYTNGTTESINIIDGGEVENTTDIPDSMESTIDNGDSQETTESETTESQTLETSYEVTTSKNVSIIDSVESDPGKQQPELSKKTEKRIDLPPVVERPSTVAIATTTSVKPPVVTESSAASEGTVTDTKKATENSTEGKIPSTVSSEASVNHVPNKVEYRKALKKTLYPRSHLKSSRNRKSNYQRDTARFRRKYDSNHSRRRQSIANRHLYLRKPSDDVSSAANPSKKTGRGNQPQGKHRRESDLLFSDVAMEEPFSRIPSQGNMFAGRRGLEDEKDEVNEFNAVEYNF